MPVYTHYWCNEEYIGICNAIIPAKHARAAGKPRRKFFSLPRELRVFASFSKPLHKPPASTKDHLQSLLESEFRARQPFYAPWPPIHKVPDTLTEKSVSCLPSQQSMKPGHTKQLHESLVHRKVFIQSYRLASDPMSEIRSERQRSALLTRLAHQSSISSLCASPSVTVHNTEPASPPHLLTLFTLKVDTLHLH